MAEVASARLDADGRLAAADPRLLALNARAGGRIGAPLAVPQLAGVARLARTLGVLVSRPVIAAEGDHDLDLLVRARPEGAGVAMSIGGWTERPPRAPWLVPVVAPPNAAALPSGWAFATDAALRLTRLEPAGDRWLGKPLTALVRLIETADGDLPILAAIAGACDLEGQAAVARDAPNAELLLTARALKDDEGRFAGFDGQAAPAAPPAPPEPETAPEPAFVDRLDLALRAPLARIVARADSIAGREQGPLRRDYADYAGDIASAGRHLLSLVDDLGDLQAVERPDFAVETEPVDLADIARRAGGLLGVRAADRGVTIDRPPPGETLMARGDFRRVLQILINLIGNAVRYSPAGAAVWLRGEQDGETVVMIVADQGKGIAADDHVRIFEMFARVDPSEPGGSGLGLYISRRLARAMGGDITVDSAPGQGARFVLTLPAA